MGLILLLLQAIWFIWPAYCANAFPTVVKGKKPLDGGKFFGKNRLFGDSKTIEGTLLGILFGIIIGSVQMYTHQFIPSYLGLFQFTLSIVVLMSIGTLVGDIAGSFIKRRLDMKPGDSAIPMDQLGFLILALIFMTPLYVPKLDVLIVLVIITPVIHIGTNVIAYAMKLKEHPW